LSCRQLEEKLGKRNLTAGAQLWTWNEQTELGEAFDSSTGFTLPNKADRSPDVSWVEKSRWSALTPEQREKFIPLCPDFVIELALAQRQPEKDSGKKCKNIWKMAAVWVG
jgi:Uma2 family endonuclease